MRSGLKPLSKGARRQTTASREPRAIGLLHEHAKKEFRFLNAELRDDILTFYAGANPKLATKKERKAWQKTQSQLEVLRLRTVLNSATLKR